MINKSSICFIAMLLVFFEQINVIAQSCNCLPGWNYRMTITITNNNAGAYSNIEVRNVVNTQALVSSGKMRDDGGDIRYFDTLCSPLAYYIESGINTSSTVIWVKVPSLPVNGTRTIYLYYGNPNAISQSSGPNTFAFYEGFDNNSLGRFGTGPVCSSGTPNVSFNGGLATFSWTASAIWLSDSSFTNTSVYTAEANVVSASGNFPGVYWARASGTQSIAVLMGNNNVSISKAPFSGSNNCVGHNLIPPIYPVSNPSGIWAITWISTGAQAASFPNVGSWTTNDNELPKDQPLRLGLGGISTGSGSYTINWVRARKYAPSQPSAVNGAELSAPAGPGNSCSAVTLSFSSIRVSWQDNASNEDKYRIERSTNSGTNWILIDSVGANSTVYDDTGLQPETGYCYKVYAVNCFGVSGYSNMACSTTSPIGIIKLNSELPKEYKLYQNSPNPFNPVTKIKFDIPKTSLVKIHVYDLTGRVIIELVNDVLSPGVFVVEWDAANYASGMYFCRMESGDYVKNVKMIVLK